MTTQFKKKWEEITKGVTHNPLHYPEWEEFANLVRQVWGSNVSLDSDEVSNMTRKDIQNAIRNMKFELGRTGKSMSATTDSPDKFEKPEKTKKAVSKYDCDICHNHSGANGEYFGYNSTYGWCDNPKCKEIAQRKLRASILDEAGRGNFDSAFDLMGDEDFPY